MTLASLQLLLRVWRLMLLTDDRYTILSYLGTALATGLVFAGFTRLGLGSNIATLIAICLIIPFHFVVFLIRLRLPWPSLAEPLLIAASVGKYDDLRFEEEFRNDISNWQVCTVETMYYGCDLMLRAGMESFLRTHERPLRKFLTDCYDEDTGFFRLTPTRPKSSAQYAHCAIGALRTISTSVRREPISLQLADPFMGDRFGDLSLRVFERAKMILGGRADAQDETLVELYSCFAILRNLGQHRLVVRLKNSDLSRFMSGLIQRKTNHAAFRIRPDCDGCVNATYFGLRLLNVIDIKPETLVRADEIVKFLITCWNGRAGGFSSVEGSVPTVLHTKMALDVFRLVGYRPDVNLTTRVLDFVHACRMDEGYAFSPGLTPNIYATRCAIQIAEYLAHSGVPQEEVEKRIPKQAGPDLINVFYAEETGGFRGYPTRSRVSGRKEKAGTQ